MALSKILENSITDGVISAAKLKDFAAAVDLNGVELILDADQDTSITADTDDQIDIKISGADDFRFTANTFTALSGSGIVVPDGGLTLGSTAISATAAEINLIDGGTSTGTTAVADADGIITNDGGTMRLTTAATFKTYFQEGISTAYDDLTTGDAAVNIATSAGNITIDAQGNDTDIIFKGTDGGADTTYMTIDGSAGGDLFLTGGLIDLKNDGSAVSQIKFYCESSNAHAQTLIGAPHSESATNTLTLPSTGGNSYLLTAASTATLTNKTLTTPIIAEIDSGSTITLDATTDIILDADGGDVFFKDGGTTIATLSNTSSDFVITTGVQDKDFIIKGDDGGAAITALTLDMSAAGAATFNDKIIATELDISGNVDIDGTTNLDAVDIDGAVQLDATLTIGANDQGYDVILYGDTASANLTWDTSADDLIFNGAAGLIVPDGQLTLGSTAVTSTAAELNLIDGGTSRGTDAVASGDGILINDAGTMKMTNVDTVSTYFSSHNVGGGNIVTTGALNSGSITSGFGAIDNGSSAITTTGVITGGTVEATTDTAAGDNAAIGYTAAEGLILTGQGSTSDITLKNDADGTVFTVPTGTDDILFPDNAKAMFGAGSDLQIYHDATNSLLVNSTGGLRLCGDTIYFRNGANDENGLLFTADGSVDIYHNNTKKFETTAAGVTVSGTTVMSGSGQSGGPNDSGSTQVDTVAEFSGAGNQRLYVGTDTSNNEMWFQNNNPGSLDVNYGINMQPVGGILYVTKGAPGDLRVGNFAANGTGQGVKINSDANQGSIIVETNLTTARSLMLFVNGNGQVGTIQTSSSATSYNTSSDYRLKENVDYTWDATTRLKQLKPARFNFKVDDTNTLVDGFLAHEVSSVVPEAISGAKDAMTAEVLYAEGDELPEGKSVGDVKTASAPDYQGIDQSKLVPLLVKTIQELEARITALEG